MPVKRKFITISSPIRWTGSKKQIVEEVLSYMPDDKGIYIEPFLGSGTILLNVIINNEEFSFRKFYVNDINRNLIFFFNKIKNNRKEVSDKIKKYVNKYNALPNNKKEEYYYDIRKKYNRKKLKSVERASLLYFLTKTCFNGVYRENNKGEYNVPFGKKGTISFSEEKFIELSKLIKNVKFSHDNYPDFLENVIEKEDINDCFIYCDPPYIPDDDAVCQTQILYSNIKFNHKDFVNNLEIINDAKIMISMSESKRANSIYHGRLRKRKIEIVTRIVNPSKNKLSKEVIYLNYIK